MSNEVRDHYSYEILSGDFAVPHLIGDDRDLSLRFEVADKS